MELSPYYEKEITCIHCKKTFKSLKVRSKFIKIADQDSDFKPLYEEGSVNGLYYNVFVCEHCGFSFTDDFTKYFAPNISTLIDEKISKNWETHNFSGERSIEDALQVYMLALFSGDLKQERNITLAGLALRIAWLYRDLENTKQEERFLEIARNQYVESFSNEDYARTQMSEVRVLYLIAELSRRINDREEAIRYFSRVIEKQRSTNETKIIEMAKDSWQEMRSDK